MADFTLRDIRRFWKKVAKGSPEECWPWTAYCNPMGYGKISWRGKPRIASRVSMEIAGFDIPDDLHVCHTCDNPPCVNPAHLFVGTRSDNMQDSIAKGRFVDPLNGVLNRDKTHCKRGHAFTESNTHIRRDGSRVCRTCSREKMREVRKLLPPKPRVKKTHCKRGHAFTPENTNTSSGVQRCRACARDKARVERGYGERPTAQVINRAKTHCKQGHEFTVENTNFLKTGGRACRECGRISMRRLRVSRINAQS